MNYLTLKEASEATGLNETTIRRLCKKPSSKPYIAMKKGKQGDMYTIDANYLFNIYQPLTPKLNKPITEVDNDSIRLDNKPIQDYTFVLEAKNEVIQILKSENAHLRSENISLREENKELKLLPPATKQYEAKKTHNSIGNRILYIMATLASVLMLIIIGTIIYNYAVK